jgi:hypothetical protein
MTSTNDSQKKNLKVADAKPVIQSEPKKVESDKSLPQKRSSEDQNVLSSSNVKKAKKDEDVTKEVFKDKKKEKEEDVGKANKDEDVGKANKDEDVEKAKKVNADVGSHRPEGNRPELVKKPKKVVVEDDEEEEEEEDVDDEEDDESEDEDDDESNISEIVSSAEEEVIEPIPPETEEMLAKLEADRILASIKGTSCVNGRVLRDRTKIVNPTVDRYGDKERELLFIKDEKKELIREIKIWRETPDLLNKVVSFAWPVLNVRMSLESIRLEHERVRIALGLESTDEESESCNEDEDEDEDEEVEDDEEEEDEDEDEDDDDDDEEEEEGEEKD